ncbi:alpha/beta hydrolase [Rhodalgimonas zhirmunskyi]|uniref:Alpha/beta fold hydrolase n=1 Tax=Rhodalgimonas zhirmunskyi TaxID=2964767 RepID=A0AAJ1UAM6_9RHOB|nr:alpha/beta fold hydrolase [Rhodoalgimonas zhirmunskyi]MDQ2093071.1 alpha/beta fold hydrolase [Rhodoalgimonas zhirmunskyi]
MRRFSGWIVLVLALVACTPRPDFTALAPETSGSAMAPQEPRIQRLYVATTRRAEPAGSTNFGDQPAENITYLRYDFAVPPTARKKRYWSDGTPDPQHDYLVKDVQILSRATFFRGVARDNADNDEAQVPLFVHGFNVRYPEAVLRFAKLSADTAGPDGVGRFGAPVLFSWPSEGRLMGYLADRDEAQVTREAFAGFLSDMSRARGDVLLAAHSLGAWMSMESLRTLALQGRRDVIDDLDIVLVAPDIDILVFRQQLAAMTPLERPIVVLVATDDRALKLSAQLSTKRPRLGALNVKDPVVAEGARREDVQLIDISSVKPVTAARHTRFVNMAGVWHELEQNAGSFDAFREGGAFVLNQLGTGLLQVGSVIGD